MWNTLDYNTMDFNHKLLRFFLNFISKNTNLKRKRFSTDRSGFEVKDFKVEFVINVNCRIIQHNLFHTSSVENFHRASCCRSFFAFFSWRMCDGPFVGATFPSLLVTACYSPFNADSDDFIIHSDVYVKQSLFRRRFEDWKIAADLSTITAWSEMCVNWTLQITNFHSFLIESPATQPYFIDLLHLELFISMLEGTATLQPLISVPKCERRARMFNVW